MTIKLSDEIEEMVNERVNSGAYTSPNEVILASLRLLKAYEERLVELKSEIQAGVDAIEQGRFVICETDQEIDDFTAEIINQAKERKNNVSPNNATG